MNYSRRIARALFGLLLFGTGSCCNIQANVGLAPWEAFSMGVGARLGLSFGTVLAGSGLVILAVDLLLREKIGLGTLLDIACIGPIADLLRAAGAIPVMTGFSRRRDPVFHRRRRAAHRLALRRQDRRRYRRRRLRHQLHPAGRIFAAAFRRRHGRTRRSAHHRQEPVEQENAFLTLLKTRCSPERPRVFSAGCVQESISFSRQRFSA